MTTVLSCRVLLDGQEVGWTRPVRNILAVTEDAVALACQDRKAVEHRPAGLQLGPLHGAGQKPEGAVPTGGYVPVQRIMPWGAREVVETNRRRAACRGGGEPVAMARRTPRRAMILRPQPMASRSNAPPPRLVWSRCRWKGGSRRATGMSWRRAASTSEPLQNRSRPQRFGTRLGGLLGPEGKETEHSAHLEHALHPRWARNEGEVALAAATELAGIEEALQAARVDERQPAQVKDDRGGPPQAEVHERVGEFGGGGDVQFAAQSQHVLSGRGRRVDLEHAGHWTDALPGRPQC
jgi:hypothetical protein